MTVTIEDIFDSKSSEGLICVSGLVIVAVVEVEDEVELGKPWKHSSDTMKRNSRMKSKRKDLFIENEWLITLWSY